MLKRVMQYAMKGLRDGKYSILGNTSPMLQLNRVSEHLNDESQCLGVIPPFQAPLGETVIYESMLLRVDLIDQLQYQPSND